MCTCILTFYFHILTIQGVYDSTTICRKQLYSEMLFSFHYSVSKGSDLEWLHRFSLKRKGELKKKLTIRYICIKCQIETTNWWILEVAFFSTVPHWKREFHLKVRGPLQRGLPAATPVSLHPHLPYCAALLVLPQQMDHPQTLVHWQQPCSGLGKMIIYVVYSTLNRTITVSFKFEIDANRDVLVSPLVSEIQIVRVASHLMEYLQSLRSPFRVERRQSRAANSLWRSPKAPPVHRLWWWWQLWLLSRNSWAASYSDFMWYLLWINFNMGQIWTHLPILKGDVSRKGAEVIKISSDWLSFPVDKKSSNCTSESQHWY